MTDMNSEDPMQFDEVRIDIMTGKGTRTVPGVVFNWAEGLAITMVNFGAFNITHIKTKRKILAQTFRFHRAVLELSQLEMIARSCGFSWADCGAEIMKIHGGKDVPFDGATITSSTGVRKMTIRDWIYTASSQFYEFPWEEERPLDEAERNVELLMSIKGESND